MTTSSLLFRELGNLGARSGALVRDDDGGTQLGTILVETGRVCWARSLKQRGRLTDLLLAHSDNALSRPVLENVVRRCREHREPVGEFLVRENLVSYHAMRTALLRHTCEAVRDIVAAPLSPDAGWSWVEHRGTGYSADLTFSPAEIFSGVHAIDQPTESLTLTTRLERTLRRGQVAFAISDDGVDLTPRAQIACDVLPTHTLLDLIPHARELVSLGSFSAAKGIVASTDEFAYAVWKRGAYIHVIVDANDFGFNNLVSQLSTIQD